MKRRQIDAIAADLLSGEPVDAVTAASRHSIWRLSSLIHRLRARGWPITASQDHGTGLARYALPEGWKPPC
ncbi:MAG: hypothetical protein KDJ22_04785 [Candidatus Competibacteraceae bacterium]|nr:hypothetical protein [Candidatus Competibacteraceae bacterium]MCP5127258.1 hypothetical protein [Gammaproteobacteria bacterium]HRX71652.1 helix-turn-helix domain-containing protein [Candidatus Competibacteraceae bacterium]